MAVRFCGRHAGDQGSGRTDWAGPEPPGSPGTRLFNHGAAKQSDGELHTPLVSLLPLCLCLHLCLSRSASLLLQLFPLRPHPAAAATRLSALFLLQLVITLSALSWPEDFVVVVVQRIGVRQGRGATSPVLGQTGGFATS